MQIDIRTVRYYLYDHPGRIEYEIEKLTKEIEEYKNMDIDSITMPIITGTPKEHKNESRVETIVVKRVDHIRKKEAKKFQLMLLNECIESELQSIKEGTAIDYVIKEKYFAVYKKSWEKIAQIYNYAYDAIKSADYRFTTNVLSRLKNAP